MFDPRLGRWRGSQRMYRTNQMRREGTATPYSVFHMQERGTPFVPPGTRAYEGMVVGEYSRDNDLNVSIVREKKLTNIRAGGRLL